MNSNTVAEPKNMQLSVLKQISKSNFSVYLSKCPQDSKLYAMKVFPYQEEEIHISFARELLAYKFNHPNVMKLVDYNTSIQTECGNKSQGYSSYTVMELAPHGDLADLVMSGKLPRDDKFVRTLFHYLCEGTKYLHSKKFAHMDIKLDNILIGENYLPRISDFDSLKSLSKKNEKIARSGTVNFRAPELAAGDCKDGVAADIYSLGITLLCLQFGMFPYVEKTLHKGVDLQLLLQESSIQFFKHHDGSKYLPSQKQESFKELVFGMTKKNPLKRFNFNEISKNEWFNGSTYSESEFREIMKAAL